MSSYDDIYSRWKFDVPAAYRAMEDAGLLNSESDNYLYLSDTEWYDPEGILAYDKPAYVIDGLIPFAQQADGSHWCWMRDKGIEGCSPVAHCPRDSNTATVYAPSFSGCLYRLLLEEMSGTLLVGEDFKSPGQSRTLEEASNVLRRYAESVAPILPAAWAGTLKEIAARPLTMIEEDVYATYTRDEAAAIVRRDLAFPWLDLEFMQHTDTPLAPSLSGFQKSVDLFGQKFTLDDIANHIDRNALHLARWEHQGLETMAPENLTLGRVENGLLVPIRLHYVPQCHYNPAILAVAKLILPSCLLVIVPLESRILFMDFLRRVAPLPLWIKIRSGLIPVHEFLAKSRGWDDL